MKVVALFSGHEASAVVLEDGVVKNYFREERYSRKKHDNGIEHIYQMILDSDPDYIILSTNYDEDEKRALIRKVNPRVKFIETKESVHHLHHASLAFYNSGFDKALVVVVDACGGVVGDDEYEGESIYYAGYPCKFTPVYKKNWTSENVIDDPNIGNLYNSAALAIGQTIDDCGKAMGLSSYGERIWEIKFTLDRVNNYFQECPDFKDVMMGERDRYHIDITKDNYKKFADYCCEVQWHCQERVCELVDKYVKKTGVNKVCLSGGYAMNILTNYQLIKRFPEVEFYFEPLCDDGGNSIGAAMYAYRKLTQDMTVKPITTTAHHGIIHKTDLIDGEYAYENDIARLLYKNKSVAIFNGHAESGQRALGNRSILFNALNPDARDIVNRIKKREWYRPFAAIVLEEDAHLYFDDVIPNPYMTVCFPVKTDLIPGVTHVDKTCRVQTVSTGHLYDILLQFKQLSGHGILLNTSFNLAGEPLVETPEQAILTLCESDLDHLWFYETKQLL